MFHQCPTTGRAISGSSKDSAQIPWGKNYYPLRHVISFFSKNQSRTTARRRHRGRVICSSPRLDENTFRWVVSGKPLIIFIDWWRMFPLLLLFGVYSSHSDQFFCFLWVWTWTVEVVTSPPIRRFFHKRFIRRILCLKILPDIKQYQFLEPNYLTFGDLKFGNSHRIDDT